MGSKVGGDCCERLKKRWCHRRGGGRICQMDRISVDGDVGDGEEISSAISVKSL